MSGGRRSGRDEALEGGARARIGAGRVEQPCAVVVRENDAHHVEDEFADVEIGPKVALFDTEFDRTAQFALQPREVLDHRVANRSWPVIELRRGRMHRAAVRQAAAHGPVDPVGEERAQARQSAPRLERGQEYGLGESRRPGLDGRDLQFFARTEMGEQAALRQPGAFGQRADRQLLEAAFAGLCQCGVEDCGTRIVALAHDRNSTNGRAICQGVICEHRNLPCVPTSAMER